MRFVPLLFVLILTACVAAGPGKTGKSGVSAENPITGGAIAVTTLNAAASGKAEVPRPKANPALIPVAGDPAKPAVAKPDAKPTDAEPVTEAPVAPPRVMTAAETTCVKQGGRWGKAGKSGAETCIKLTKDNGKRCDSESDCEGYCLSRSMTCAPFIPMFGCNDIIQDNGVQVTLCID